MAAIADGSSTVLSIAESLADRIEKKDPAIHAFTDFDREYFLSSAAALDQRPPRLRGPLHGLVIAVKEVFDVVSHRCGWGLPVLHGRVATRDAALVKRLKRLGALIAGTTASTELAIARAGPTRNPLDLSRTPGGSSSGSAAAVAAGMVPLAIGSQTIGSIMRPAAYCGIFGLKPGHGSLDLEGMMPLAPQLDHVGFLSRSLDDLQLIVQTCLRGPAASMPSPVRRVLVAPEDRSRPLRPAFRSAIEACSASLSAMGIEVEPLQMPLTFSAGFSLAETLVAYGIAQHHGTLLQRYRPMLSPRLQRLLARGETMTRREYLAALEQRGDVARSITGQLGQDAVILAPTTEDFAPAWNKDCSGSPVYQALWTLTGLPALSAPVTCQGALPASVQFVASQHSEAALLDFARQLSARFAATSNGHSTIRVPALMD